MKKLLMTVCLIAASAAFAETPVKTDAEKEALAKERREAMLKKTGGIIQREGKGKIVFVNCQKTISEDLIRQRVDKTSFVLKYNCELRAGSWNLAVGKPDDATIAIYIVDDEALPMSLVAAEARWGVVNVRGLKPGNRFAKELTRVVTLTAGVALSPVKTSVMKTVTNPADLDGLGSEGFTQDMAMAIFNNMAQLGAVQSRPSSYLKACKEGWAPTPTNDYQKAIWEQVKAEANVKPSNPIKITKPQK